MRSSIVVVSAVLVASLVGKEEAPVAAASSTASSVVQLTDDTFDEFVNSQELSMVKFYAPWCGICKQIKPDYEKAAQDLAQVAPNIKMASIDCTEQKKQCERYGIPGYPTMKVFRRGGAGEGKDYKGARGATDFVNYLVKQSAPLLTAVTSENIVEFTNSQDIVVVGSYAPGSPEEKAFKAAAEALRDTYTFGAVEQPSVTVYKKFDDKIAVFRSSEFTEDAIKAFVKAEAIPLVDEIGRDNYTRYMESPLPLAYAFYEGEEQKAQLKPELEAATKQFRGKINSVFINAALFGQFASGLNLEVGKWPALVVHTMESDSKYPYAQGKAITAADLTEHFRGVLSGDIKPTYKSEPVPSEEEFKKAAVKTVVYNNFESVVQNPAADVLVEFYLPNCPACINLDPIYTKLGEKWAASKQHSSNLVIVKMNVVANDIPKKLQAELQAFPTIKLYKARKDPKDGQEKEVITFDSARTVNSFLEFLEKNATHSDLIKSVEREPEEDSSSNDAKKDDAKDAAKKEEL